MEFHITEDLNLDNLNKPPIQISEKERNELQKSGKVEVYCSCDSDKVKPPEPVNLDGKLTHYQHAQGIGMTDDKNPNINPKFYFSEIKTLEPILFNKGEPNTEVMKQLLNLLLNQLLIIILLELPIIILKIEPIIIPLINQKLLLELIIEE